MTVVAAAVPTNSLIPSMIGSSVSWSRFALRSTPRTVRPHDPELSGWHLRPQTSMGVSDGATAIQQFLQQLTAEMGAWQMKRSSTLADVEQEVIVLMPPKRERLVTITIASDADTAFGPAVVLAEDDAMASLESAATAGDERAFLAAKDMVDWETRPAADFLRAVQLALSAGAHMAARNLAAQAAVRYPDDADLQKYARVLAPPRVLRSDAPPHPGLRANRDWLMTCGDKYRGQWVALRQGKLLGAADSLAALKELIGDTNDILLTKVF